MTFNDFVYPNYYLFFFNELLFVFTEDGGHGSTYGNKQRPPPNLENMTYSDPLGPERPRTAAMKRGGNQVDDDFGNVDADELLPE